MSEDISTNESTSKSVAETVLLKPWSAETYADQLMDDLFSDIDRILEGGNKLPTETVKQEYVSLQSIKIPLIAKPLEVMPLREVLTKLGDQANAEQPPTKPNGDNSDVKQAVSGAPRRGYGQYFVDKLLLVVTCGSLVVALILWWASHEKLHLPFGVNVGTTPDPENNLSQSDAQLINYMLRSLELIDRKTQVSQQQTSPPEISARQLGVPSVPYQPPATVASNLPQAPNPVPTVVGIYIPGYPPPMYQQPRIAGPVSQSSSIRPPTVNSIRPPAANLVSPQSLQLPQPLQSPVARGPVAPVPTVASTPIPTPAAPEAKHTLVGLLYLGEHSAALFDISGVTQRIQVGEPIGGSGWTLVAVTKEEAIIRRNGEVRSIYAGQKF